MGDSQLQKNIDQLIFICMRRNSENYPFFTISGSFLKILKTFFSLGQSSSEEENGSAFDHERVLGGQKFLDDGN